MQIFKKEEELNAFIKENDFVMIDFFANWCGPCKMMAPHLEDLALDKDFQDLKIAKFDIDEDERVANTYKLYSIPALYFFKGGDLKEVHKAIGYHTLDELKELVKKVR